MSKFVNGGTRPKNARETYVEQFSNGRGLTSNKKRNTFTSLNPLDDGDLAYRSTPNYLRQIAQQALLSPTEMISARNIPRTKSASELTPRNNLNRSMTGNPKYKAQEDYYDEVQSLKKDMKTIKDENSNLRAKIRRLEEDNTRKRKEIDALYDTNKDGDLRRTLAGSSTDRSNNNNSPAANVVMSLKQRLFKLELQLKQKETIIDEIKSDPRWTKCTEFEIQNRALFGELERQKVERLNYIQPNDYMASIDEETKNAVRKLNREKDELKKENESLKKKVHELEKFEPSEQLSARRSDDLNDKELLKKTEDFKQMKDELDRFREKFDEIKRDRDQCRKKLEQTKENLVEIEGDRDQYRKKLEQTKEDLAEIKHDRDQYKKKFDQATEELEHEREKQTKFIQAGRSSPGLKHDEKQYQNSLSLSSTPTKRPQSPIVDKPTKTDYKPTRSPPSTSKFDNLGSDYIKSRPSSANISNEPALKTVQASLRGHLNRSEINKTPEQTSARGRVPTSMKKLESIESGNEDDIEAISSSEEKRDSFPDRPKVIPRHTLSNDKIRSNTQLPLNNRDLSPNPRQSPADNQRPLSPHVGRGGVAKENVPSDRNKLASNNRFPTRDKDPSAKSRQTPSPPPDNYRSSSPRIGSGGGSKQNVPSDRNKLGSDNRFPTRDKDPSAKSRQTPSPPPDNYRSSSPRIGSGGGSKQNVPSDRNKLGSDNRLAARDKVSSAIPRQTPSPPPDNNRPSSPRVGSGGVAKENVPSDRNKFGPDNRLATRDKDSSAKSRQTPSPPPDNNRPSSPRVGSGGGSKQNVPSDRNKFGPDNRLATRDKDSSAVRRQTPSPPPDNNRPSSPRVGNGGGSKQNVPSDRNKLGSDNRFATRDRDSSSKLQNPSSPSNARRPTSPSGSDYQSSRRKSPENVQPPSRKSPIDSKPSIKDIPSDDDNDVIGS